MRPYLTILKDSFREAVRSRTLPFLLLFFTLVLAVVAPLGLRDETAWRVASQDLTDVRLFAVQLRRADDREGEQFGDRVLARLPADVRAALRDPTGTTKPDPPSPFLEQLTAEELLLLILPDLLNRRVLSDPTLFDPADEDLRVRGELKTLADRDAAGELPAALRPRLNRLALNAAAPFSLKAPPAEGVAVTYLGSEPEWLTDLFTGATGALTRENIERGVRVLYQTLAGWIAGVGGVLVGLLVTAALIPQTFEGGAIDLLLSKPVSRPLTFLTKFVGGCVFVGLAALYFTGGLFLIGGLRAGVWEPGMLASAAPLTLTFAVVYSVSAAAGVLWKNAIVCVLAGGLAWGGSFAFQFLYGAAAGFRDAASPRGVAAVGESVFKADTAGATAVWNPAGGEDGTGDWEPALYAPGFVSPFAPGAVYRLDGPHVDAATGRLVAFERYGMTPNGVPIAGDRRLRTADAAGRWVGEVGDPLPAGSESLFVAADGSLRAAGVAGLYFAPPPLPPEAGEKGDGEANGAPDAGLFGSLLGRANDLLGVAARRASGLFVPLAEPPEGGLWPRPFAAGYDPAADELATYSAGLVRVYAAGGGEPISAVRVAGTEPDAENRADAPPALLTRAGGKTWVALADGTGLTIEGDAVRPWPAGGAAPKRVLTAPDGARVLVLTHAGGLTLFDAATGAVLAETDGVTAAAFDPAGGVLAGTGPDRVARLDADTLEERSAVAPAEGTFGRLFRLVLTPLRYLLPDTIGLGRVTASLFAADDPAADGSPDDLRLARAVPDPIGPLVHNLAFMAAILGLTCWHVSRADF